MVRPTSFPVPAAFSGIQICLVLAFLLPLTPLYIEYNNVAEMNVHRVLVIKCCCREDDERS